MIETRKQYKREISDTRSVEIEVIYDNEVESKTYLKFADDTGAFEFLVDPTDLQFLNETIAEVSGAKLRYDNPPF